MKGEVERVARNVAIFEPSSQGHRLAYVSYILRACAAQPGVRSTIFTTTEASKSPMWSSMVASVASGTSVHSVDGLGEALAVSANLESSLFIVPDADILLYPLLKSWKILSIQKTAILLMRSQLEWGYKYWRANFVVLVKLLICLFLTAFGKVTVYRLAPPGFNFKIFNTIHDPVEVTELEFKPGKDLLTVLEGRLSVGIVGAIDRRKNIDLVADSLRSFQERTSLLVAGRIGSDYFEDCKTIKTQFDSEKFEVVLINKTLSDLQLDSIISSLDCVVIAQSNNSSSGIFLKALALGTPVACAGSPILRRLAKRYPGNAIWTKLASRDLSDAIRRAISLEPKKVMDLPTPIDFGKTLADC